MLDRLISQKTPMSFLEYPLLDEGLGSVRRAASIVVSRPGACQSKATLSTVSSHRRPAGLASASA